MPDYPLEAAQRSRALLNILARWERSSHTLDYILAQEFQRADLSAELKAQITNHAANWARGRGTARYLLAQNLKKKSESLPPPLRRRLELAVCQLLFEERTPPAILVSGAVAEIKSAYGTSLAGMANAVLRGISEQPPSWPSAESDPVAHLSAKFSHPAWIVERWLRRWGWDRTQTQLEWDNKRPSLWLRANRLRGDSQWTKERLAAANVATETNPDFDGYFRLLGAYYPAAAERVASGDFSVQDPAASLAVRLLDPGPGMRILDLCAAPGGKTTLLAEMTGDQAQIVAVDSSADRMKRLGEALGRMGIQSVEGIVTDGRQFIWSRFGLKPFDAALVDVPCSGFGVLSRRADLRWRRQEKDLPELVSLQMELIQTAARCLKVGGVLVYSTCSIEPAENEGVVNDFLRQADHFILEDSPRPLLDRFSSAPGQIATYSPRDQVDGIYAARLIRTA